MLSPVSSPIKLNDKPHFPQDLAASLVQIFDSLPI